MTLTTLHWRRSFPYQGGNVSITRFEHGWRVRMNEHETEAVSLIEAFETLRGRAVSDDDLRFILNVLAFDCADDLAGLNR
jgi:hypothetical protein